MRLRRQCKRKAVETSIQVCAKRLHVAVERGLELCRCCSRRRCRRRPRLCENTYLQHRNRTPVCRVCACVYVCVRVCVCVCVRARALAFERACLRACMHATRRERTLAQAHTHTQLSAPYSLQTSPTHRTVGAERKVGNESSLAAKSITHAPAETGHASTCFCAGHSMSGLRSGSAHTPRTTAACLPLMPALLLPALSPLATEPAAPSWPIESTGIPLSLPRSLSPSPPPLPDVHVYTNEHVHMSRCMHSLTLSMHPAPRSIIARDARDARDARTHAQTNKQTDKQTNRQTNKQTQTRQEYLCDRHERQQRHQRQPAPLRPPAPAATRTLGHGRQQCPCHGRHARPER